MKILGFSGIELFTIIVTALVQMYSIKSLLDNRAVVWKIKKNKLV